MLTKHVRLCKECAEDLKPGKIFWVYDGYNSVFPWSGCRFCDETQGIKNYPVEVKLVGHNGAEVINPIRRINARNKAV